ncbi:MAG: hypothetical protein KF690_11500 [Bacteroidetes bacterium]|nr:hypothetical protein [Bacteroidota bacterium]
MILRLLVCLLVFTASMACAQRSYDFTKEGNPETTALSARAQRLQQHRHYAGMYIPVWLPVGAYASQTYVNWGGGIGFQYAYRLGTTDLLLGLETACIWAGSPEVHYPSDHWRVRAHYETPRRDAEGEEIEGVTTRLNSRMWNSQLRLAYAPVLKQTSFRPQVSAHMGYTLVSDKQLFMLFDNFEASSYTYHRPWRQRFPAQSWLAWGGQAGFSIGKGFFWGMDVGYSRSLNTHTTRSTFGYDAEQGEVVSAPVNGRLQLLSLQTHMGFHW